MNLEKFTDRARSTVQAAQTLALRAGHQRIVPEHLLKALLDDEQGLAVNLIRAAGGDPRAAKAGVEAALARLPKVSGGDGQIYLDPGLARLLDEAGQIAEKAGDAYVSAERLLMAVAMAKGTEAAKILDSAGVRPQTLNGAI